MRADPYETERYLQEYLLLHYGQPRGVCPFRFVSPHLLRFHERLREECLLPVRGRGRTRGLDLGCAVGRFTFELGRVVDHVLGVDNSRPFIRAARRMAKDHALKVRVHESGAQFTTRRLVLPPALRRCDVEFRVGDAQDLAAFPENAFQVVAAINLVCRLPRPRAFLRQLHRLVAPGGQLVIGSPATWLEEHTPRREWLTAQEEQGVLRPHFRLVRQRDLPLLIREHRRKYELVISAISVFVRRAG